MIIKAALLLFRNTPHGKELLFVRARGKPYLLFPGGKQEPGETIDAALQRELHEELGTQAADVEKLGTVTGHTPDGQPLEMHLYTGQLLADPQAHAEIDALIWVRKQDIAVRQDELTPIFTDHVAPFLAARNVW